MYYYTAAVAASVVMKLLKWKLVVAKRNLHYTVSVKMAAQSNHADDDSALIMIVVVVVVMMTMIMMIVVVCGENANIS